jgi:hypothetical protein
MKASPKLLLGLWGAAIALLIVLVLFTRSEKSSDNPGPVPAPTLAPSGSASPVPAPTRTPAPKADLARAILGKWQSLGNQEILEFRSDGLMVLSAAQISRVLQYAAVPPSVIRFTIQSTKTRGTFTVDYTNVVVEGDKLTMVTDKGATLVYARLK